MHIYFYREYEYLNEKRPTVFQFFTVLYPPNHVLDESCSVDNLKQGFKNSLLSIHTVNYFFLLWFSSLRTIRVIHKKCGTKIICCSIQQWFTSDTYLKKNKQKKNHRRQTAMIFEWLNWSSSSQNEENSGKVETGLPVSQ